MTKERRKRKAGRRRDDDVPTRLAVLEERLSNYGVKVDAVRHLADQLVRQVHEISKRVIESNNSMLFRINALLLGAGITTIGLLITYLFER